MLKIGVMPSSFRIPFKDAVIKARDMGAKGLQPICNIRRTRS